MSPIGIRSPKLMGHLLLPSQSLFLRMDGCGPVGTLTRAHVGMPVAQLGALPATAPAPGLHKSTYVELS